MNVFVGLDEFKSLNVGFALDEGMTLGASLALKGHTVPFSIHIIYFFDSLLLFNSIRACKPNRSIYNILWRKGSIV